ncbi:MAG: 5'/3'-nucleotidase SurE [Deltaproteobacteria bacterium]|nr:MAG: 5'/3'-nucleotidase SurE [Deltaproteobacteria bacterium]
MIILVSNDDGINAPGLHTLAQALEDLGEVWIVAPDRDRTAVSHSLTLHRPLRIEQIGQRKFSVNGTPSDCINIGTHQILERAPDLVVSGINQGSNLGDDINYSGTVSAAMEGALLGIPSFAISLDTTNHCGFEPAAKVAFRLAEKIIENGLPPDTFLNVNVPGVQESEFRGYRITRQGKKNYSIKVVEKTDPRDRKYYWIGGEEQGCDEIEASDASAVLNNYISVTPLLLDLTNYSCLDKLRKWKL